MPLLIEFPSQRPARVPSAVRFGASASLLLFTLSLSTTPALAQRAYVGASVTGNTIRISSLPQDVGDGSSAGVGVRAGTAIGERWGLDAEAVYPGAQSWHYSDPVALPASETPGFTILPSRYSRRLRHSTFSTALWVKQSPRDRLDLIYLGGIAFLKTEQFIRIVPPEYRFPTTGVANVIESDDTSYYAGPLLGIDAPYRLTDRIAVIPAMRLMIFRDLLIARPSLGIRWQFGS